VLLALTLIIPSSVFAAEKPKFAIVFKNTGNPYGEKQLEGFRVGIEEQGFEAILRSPDLPTAEAQIQIIEQLIAQKVASICISGNDYDALTPVLRKASSQGIKVFSLDSSVNPQARLTHVNQADSEKIGQTLIKAAYDMAGGKGEIAILSATSQASNQNIWIDFMKKELAKPEYKDLKLVKIAYGDDLRDKSFRNRRPSPLLSEPEGHHRADHCRYRCGGQGAHRQGPQGQSVPDRPRSALRDGGVHQQRRMPLPCSCGTRLTSDTLGHMSALHS